MSQKKFTACFISGSQNSIAPFNSNCHWFFQKNSFAGADIIQYCMKKGFSPKTEYVNSLSAALVKMRTESGILIADEFLLSSQNPLFKSIDIDLTRTVCVGIRKERSKACEAAREVFLRAAQDTL